MTAVDDADVIREAALRVRNALTGLGYSYTTRRGDTVEVSFRSVQLVRHPETGQGSYGLLEIDTLRLPPRVSIAKLANPQTLHHLSAVVGKPVKLLNTTGLTYCVVLESTHKNRLPVRIEFDFDSIRQTNMQDFPVPIGHSPDGPTWSDIVSLGHILVGGESGSGKSCWLNVMLASLLLRHSPEQVRFALVDPKVVEFVPYNGIPYLLGDVATDVDGATELLGKIVGEMERRTHLFSSIFARNLKAYNNRADTPLPLILLVIDEVTDIALSAGTKSPFYKHLIRLASKGRSLGIYLVLATQNPKAEVLNTLIRGNLSTRISFRVATPEHSRIILGLAGAETLPRSLPGRMLARYDGDSVQLQGYLLEDDDLFSLLAGLREKGGFSVLEGAEVELVKYAHEELLDAFPIDGLYEQFKGRISRRQILKLARRWESRGWLTPACNTEPRSLTPDLIALAYHDN